MSCKSLVLARFNKAAGGIPQPFCVRVNGNAGCNRKICEVDPLNLIGLPINFARFTYKKCEVSDKNLRGLCIIFARFT